RSFVFEGYQYTVDADVAAGPLGLCDAFFPPELWFYFTLSTKAFEGGSEWASGNLVLKMDGETVPFTATVDGSTATFTAFYSKPMPRCPVGHQRGSSTFTAQFHDQNHTDTWVTGVTIVMPWDYECNRCCQGEKDPLKVDYRWTGPQYPD